MTTTPRLKRLIDDAIAVFDLDLSGLTVLTEAASGHYAATPLIASLGGAERVIAIGRDSRFGKFSENAVYIEKLAKSFGAENIQCIEEDARAFAAEPHLITNLGFVRPFDRHFISRMRKNAVISLMWEPWELREDEIDIDSCKEYGIRVYGTNERDERLQTFKYVGFLVLKLLLEKDIEVLGSKILLVGEGIFVSEAMDLLEGLGAKVLQLKQGENINNLLAESQLTIAEVDSVVLLEHQSDKPVIGDNSGIPIAVLEDSGIELIHISGVVDDAELKTSRIQKYPAVEVKAKYMTKSTDYVGPKPMIDLHTAGLKVGQLVLMNKVDVDSRNQGLALPVVE